MVPMVPAGGDAPASDFQYFSTSDLPTDPLQAQFIHYSVVAQNCFSKECHRGNTDTRQGTWEGMQNVALSRHCPRSASLSPSELYHYHLFIEASTYTQLITFHFSPHPQQGAEGERPHPLNIALVSLGTTFHPKSSQLTELIKQNNHHPLVTLRDQ